ncbi:MAG: hypothetical protein K2L86_13075 [Lachnospiraceae bacterium]|nr:hypothetical protein [Lachnospiraceae bacterium]
MQKKDLKTGMMVKTNNGFLYLVMRDTGMNISDITDNDVLLAISDSGKIYNGWMGLSSYNDDLEHEDKDYSIAEIFSTKCAANIGSIKHYKTIWKSK